MQPRSERPPAGKAHPAAGKTVLPLAELVPKLEDAESPAIAHAILQGAARRRWVDIEGDFDRERRAFAERMKVQDVRPDIERAAERALVEIEILAGSAGGGGGGDLDTLRTEYADKLRDYSHFKENNHLDREPYYPESKLRHLAVAGIVVLIETSLNGNLLAVGLESGLFQGLGVALLISVINVGGAGFAGYGARLIHVRNAFRKRLGFLCAFFGVGCLIPFNLLTAHFREAISTSGGNVTLDAGKLALDSFSQSWFGVSDFMSWALFGLGVFAALIGAGDGYTIEDPYPGYGRRHRALKDARDRFQQGREAAMDEIADIQRKGAKHIDNYVEQFRSSLKTAQGMRANLLELPKRLQGERKKLLADVPPLQAKYCPAENPVVLDEPQPEPEPPLVESIDFALVEECARSHSQELADRCNSARSDLRVTT